MWDLWFQVAEAHLTLGVKSKGGNCKNTLTHIEAMGENEAWHQEYLESGILKLKILHLSSIHWLSSHSLRAECLYSAKT